MWFKQIQLFQLPHSFTSSTDQLKNNLDSLLFKPCLPSMPMSMGWTTLLDENHAPLTRTIQQCTMICLQIEEKVLPATVVRQALAEKIKQIEALENRKIRQKEKFSLKDEIMMTLLPRAFSKLTRIHAYLDIKHHWLVLGTTNPKKTEQFLSIFKKTISENIQLLDLKKLSPIMTHWLKEQNYPSSFSIENACVLQDPNQQNRIIRCQQQNLFANSIQSLLKEGCEVKQLALSWEDQVNFVLSDDFTLRSIQFNDAIREQIKDMEAETEEERFNADFMIMTGVLSRLLEALLNLFAHKEKKLKTSEPMNKSHHNTVKL